MSERYYILPSRAQCLRLSERFLILLCDISAGLYVNAVVLQLRFGFDSTAVRLLIKGHLGHADLLATVTQTQEDYGSSRSSTCVPNV